MDPLDALEATIRSRRGADPTTSYVASLFARGRGKIAQKLGEEAVETVIAATSDTAKIVPEAADLVFHLLILLADAGLSLDDVRAELARREGVSGHDEEGEPRLNRQPRSLFAEDGEDWTATRKSTRSEMDGAYFPQRLGLGPRSGTLSQRRRRSGIFKSRSGRQIADAARNRFTCQSMSMPQRCRAIVQM